MPERPAALDGLLGYVACNLPDEEDTTAKTRAAIAPLEQKIREARAQERAELRGATLAAASEHLRTTLFPTVYEDAGQRTAEGVTRAASELLRMVSDPAIPTATWPSQQALDKATLDVPIAISIVYAVRGRPDVPDEYNETRTIRPREITLTYRAASDGQLGRIHAYVKGWWMQGDARVPMDSVGRHFTGDPAGWPKWLAAEARQHDPGQPS
ncbi:hypothetical protein PV735_05450 [Streptomyces turgidiscabies]|uniref:Uncharacterized protein n=1 Tax=Streptomyces turgidiscabies (strain Car8) TaxID=698760 RepID=L7EZP0_STRT8|nr:hypothetical protein [Streptomyces turgidiscabies]ELP64171.1 hypothetical protein STRTUCAR8_05558 [Streptomyces turgidiscabies Car8]MDX3492135.1 hypothetical protein [Streptomyces turgidiscabies]